MTPQIYTSAVAQHENLGDVVLRKMVIRHLSGLGRLHLLAPDCPDWYIQEIATGTTGLEVHQDRHSWLRSLVLTTKAGDSCLVYSPGPQKLGQSPRLIGSELARAALSHLLSAFGSQAMRIGRSFEGSSRPMEFLVAAHSRGLALSTARDTRLQNRLGPHHHVLPDLALGWGDAMPTFGGTSVVVSLRYDRDHDLDKIAQGLRRACEITGLIPIVLTQVSFDRGVSAQLADRLQCQHVDATADGPSALQVVRDTYRGSALTLSDRLHALIFGLVHGSIPIHLPTNGASKVAMAMGTVLSRPLLVTTPESVQETIVELEQERTRATLQSDLAHGRKKLETLDRLLAASLSGSHRI